MTDQNKLKEIQKAMDNAQSYLEYRQACESYDEYSGADSWKEFETSEHYDYKLIRKRVSRIKEARTRKDAAGLMFILHEGIHGNLGNIANPDVNNQCKIGTKKLIEEFLQEVCTALEYIYNADEQEIDFYDKLAFFEETTHAYGQSCLMLSGGAGLGFFHAGVIKALTENKLMPKVISGASAGSIMAGLIGTRKDDELLEVLQPEVIHDKFKKWGVWNGIFKESLLDPTNLENALIEMFDLMTFEEAYKRTGRHITVTVSPADLHQYSRLLNARTSPNAIIVQAVRASCAIPYVFSPVQLKAKNYKGEVVPYIPNRKFADGSVMADMPFSRLARLYGVNHSIVSQTNPLAVPFLSRTKEQSKGFWSMTKRHIAKNLKSNSVYLCDVIESNLQNKTAKLGIHKVRSIIDQQYVGDVNIVPARGITNLKYLLKNPSIEGIQTLISSAERETWKQLDLIERSTRISNTFNYYLEKLREEEKVRLSRNVKSA
jgi:predicted acylesterase/phospholipase RssA